MNDTTENPVIGYADDGSRIDGATSKTEMIEVMLSRFDEIVDPATDRSARGSIFASLGWSYKMKLGRSISILFDLGAGMAEAIEREQESRQESLAEAIRKTEAQIDEMENLYKWAASQATPRFLPSDKDIVDRLQADIEADSDTVKEYAEAMGCTEEEAKEDLKAIKSPTVEMTIKYEALVLEELKRRTQGEYGEFTFSDWNAVSTMERIAEKSAQYMITATGNFKQTRIPSRRKRYLSNAEAFKQIMESADALAVRFRNEAETAQQLADESKSAAHEADQPQMA